MTPLTEAKQTELRHAIDEMENGLTQLCGMCRCLTLIGAGGRDEHLEVIGAIMHDLAKELVAQRHAVFDMACGKDVDPADEAERSASELSG